MNDQHVQRLVATRSAIGVGAWLAPRLSGRMFGLDPAANPQAPYLGRLFGVRDIALGVGLSQSRGAERQQWLRIGVACDLADAAAGILAGRAGELPKRSTLLVTATALAAAAMGIAAMRGEEPSVPS
ncbi:MAG TPA: hypothetical protein VGH24_10995 [Solirubrobacteraceae bacterium]|jgi:hypothetical protein